MVLIVIVNIIDFGYTCFIRILLFTVICVLLLEFTTDLLDLLQFDLDYLRTTGYWAFYLFLHTSLSLSDYSS